MKIAKPLTDNGARFTGRFTSKGRQPTGRHSFDQACAGLGIGRRLSPPRHPQTNGMVGRFNGRASELLKQTRFSSAGELEKTLPGHLVIYNHHTPQRAIKHLSKPSKKGKKTSLNCLLKWIMIRWDLTPRQG